MTSLIARSLLVACALTSHTDTVVVTAGSPAVDGRLVPRGHWTRRVQLVAGDDTADLGTLAQELRDARFHGREGLLSVIRYEGPGGVTTDTAFSDPRTLAPIAHRSHNASRVMALDFDGTAVTGRVAPTDGAATEIDERTDVPVFDSNTGDLVVSALPLAAGYRARVPWYIHEQGGEVWNEVAVTGSEDGPEPAWIVEVHSESGGRVMRYRIAKASRRVLGLSATLPDGRVIRYVPAGDSG